MSFTNEWSLERISEEMDTRTKPGNADAMQKRGHFVLERFRKTDETWTSEVGDTASSLSYFVGEDERTAGPISGADWHCTADSAESQHEGVVSWRMNRQRWESWSDWSDFNPGAPFESSSSSESSSS